MAGATLYELLGVAEGANTAQIQAGYRAAIGRLEALRASMAHEAFRDREQMLKVAYTTLADPAARTGYDAKLSARQRGSASDSRALAAGGAAPQLPVPPKVHADALALRADALSLRADAMLLRAAAEGAGAGGPAQGVASGLMTALKRVVRAIGLLVVVCVVAFMLARCAFGDASERRAKAEAKAREQTALQEYYQAHGVRPANMAELELLEAERRRKENEQNQASQNVHRQQEAERQFQEDSLRRAEQVSERLRADEERARLEAEREQERKRAEEEARQRRAEAERERALQEQQRWRSELRR